MTLTMAYEMATQRTKRTGRPFTAERMTPSGDWPPKATRGGR
jgi:hypothetical protein